MRSRAAAQNNNIGCLRYAHENTCCHAVVSWDSKECFAYAIKNGCPWSPRTIDYIIALYKLDIFKILRENDYIKYIDVCVIASKYRSSLILQFAHKNM